MVGVISMRRMCRCIVACLCISASVCAACPGPGSDQPVAACTAAQGDAFPEAPAADSAVTEKGLPLAIVKDQIPIWTSPVRIRTHDLIWLLPLGAATGLTLATDTDAMREVSRERSFSKDNVNASNALLGGEIAVPIGLYGVGLFKGNAACPRDRDPEWGSACRQRGRRRTFENNFPARTSFIQQCGRRFFCAEHRHERLVSVVTQHAGVDVGRRRCGGVPVEVGTSGRVLYRLERELDTGSGAGALPERCPGRRRRGMADRTLRVREAPCASCAPFAANDTCDGKMS